jgi:plastocyanin
MTGRARRKLGTLAAAVLAAGSCLATIPSPARASGSETGVLEGSVTLGPRLTARRMKFSLYADANRTGTTTQETKAPGEIENVVVYLESAPEGAAPTNRPATPNRIEQVGLAFKPHVLAVVKGTSVEFPNRDMLFHNVFSLSRAASFDLGRYPKDDSKSVRFDAPGIVPVFCHIHSDMSAVVVVLDNPFFTRPDEAGRFELDGIPPGTYRVVAWHERAKPTGKTIRIEAGKPTVVDFEIPLTGDARAE